MITIFVQLDFDTCSPQAAYQRCRKMLDADEAMAGADGDGLPKLEGWESTDEWWIDGDQIELEGVTKTRMRVNAMAGDGS